MKPIISIVSIISQKHLLNLPKIILNFFFVSTGRFKNELGTYLRSMQTIFAFNIILLLKLKKKTNRNYLQNFSMVIFVKETLKIKVKYSYSSLFDKHYNLLSYSILLSLSLSLSSSFPLFLSPSLSLVRFLTIIHQTNSNFQM